MSRQRKYFDSHYIAAFGAKARGDDYLTFANQKADEGYYTNIIKQSDDEWENSITGGTTIVEYWKEECNCKNK